MLSSHGRGIEPQDASKKNSRGLSRGDAFAPRSKYAMRIDFEEQPDFYQVSDTHFAATWLLHPQAPKVEMPKIVSERIKNSLAEDIGGENDGK